jgi:parallel beta-helix repeat protein
MENKMNCLIRISDKGILALLLILFTASSVYGAWGLNVGEDWTNSTKDFETTGDVTAADGIFSGEVAAGSHKYNQGDTNAVDTTIEAKLQAQVVSSSDYTSLALAISNIGAVTPTNLHICGTNSVADSTTVTATSNITLDFTQCRGTIQGAAGGGTETLTINGGLIADPSQQIFGSNLTVTYGALIKKSYSEHWGIDSTSDETEINLASAAIATNGGTVVLDGAYVTDGSILIRDNIKYKGTGSITFASGVTASTIMFTNDDQDVGNTEFEISGLKLDGNRAANSAITGLKAIALYAATTKGRIADNYMTGFTHSGVQIEGVGISGGTLDSATENIIESNIIDDYGTGAVGFGVVLIRGASRNKVLNNHITSSLTNNCITIDDYSTSGNSYDSQHNIIKGNNTNGGGAGIVVEGCTYNIVSENIVRNASVQGISLRSGTAGDLVRSPIRPDYNIVKGNTVISSGTVEKCIYMSDGYYCQINDNNVNGGLISVELHNAVIGIIIDGNMLTGMAQNAIYAVVGNTIQITNNIIDGVISGGYCTEGIYLASSSGTFKWSKVSGNTLSATGKEGIKILKGVSSLYGITVADNYIINASKSAAATYYGIKFEGAITTSWVYDNHGDAAADYIDLLFVDNEATGVLNYGNNDTINWDFSSFEMIHRNFSSGTLAGATDTIEVNLPVGAIIVGVSLNVEVAVTDDAGDDTWSAEFNDGATVAAIVTGAAAAQNTKVKKLLDPNTETVKTDAGTDILLTPNGGNFSAGEIRASVWYIVASDLPDAL